MGLSPVPKGKGAPTPEAAVLDDSGCLGILVTPLSELSISIKKPWVVLDVAGKKTDLLNQYGSHLLCPYFSLWTSFL